MAQNYREMYRRYLQLAAILCWCAVGVGHAHAAAGLTRAELYQTTVPLSDRSDASQAAAYQTAMKIVLVRVTGRRTADQEAVFAPLYANSRRYVQQYRSAPDNQVWVAFDGPAIERWLTQNGQPLWGHDRPSTLVWLSVQTGPTGPTGQTGDVVTADDTSELKLAIDAAAAVRGIPLLWPSVADLQRNHLDYSSLAASGPAALGEIAHRLGADGMLVGRASNSTATAAVRWTQVFQDHSSECSGALEGVNRAADIYAGLFAASGSLAPVDIEVSGVTNLRDYASVQTYLESLNFIAQVGVASLTADIVRFHLSTRGGIEPLQHAFALNGKLLAVPVAENGIQRFQLHR